MGGGGRRRVFEGEGVLGEAQAWKQWKECRGKDQD